MGFSCPNIDIWYHFMHHSWFEKSTWDWWIQHYLQETFTFLGKAAGGKMPCNAQYDTGCLCGQVSLTFTGKVGGQPRWIWVQVCHAPIVLNSDLKAGLDVCRPIHHFQMVLEHEKVCTQGASFISQTETSHQLMYFLSSPSALDAI